MNKLAALFLAITTFFIGTAFSPLRAAVPVPAEGAYTNSLDGGWRFKLEQAPPPPRFLDTSGRPIPIVSPATIEPFYQMDYREDVAWHDIAVPSNWEMAGFSPATYNQPDNASGFYRLKFNVPAQWKGRPVRINFDGVQNGCEVWCNGQPVPVDEASWGRTNYHESGWTAWQADLTSAVQFGQTNLLALRVTKNTKSVDCDSGDYFLLGGVYRPVTLFSVPASYLNDVSVRTKLLPDDQAEVTIIAQLSQASKGSKVSMQLEGQPPVEREPAAGGQVELKQIVLHPKLWSAEFPDLYALSVDLKDADGRVTEHTTRKIGIREISFQNGIFCVNHVPVKLVGICRHDVYATLGTAINEMVWKKDLTLMKAANFNAIRTSHYPDGSGFYDLCDKMGFYVLDEEPFCWVNCSDTNLTAAFAQRARETVQRDKNHPSVVIWGVGNENKPGVNNDLAAEITRQIDPTRPRLISCQRADEGHTLVEFDDAHYVTPARIHKDELDSRRVKWPMIYSENPNVWDVRNGPDFGSLDLWGAVMDRTWAELWPDDHVTGNFLWEWQERAVADKNPTKYYYFYPKTGINLVKVKGVVDAFRNPRPEYHHIKMAQTPIAFGGQPEVSGDTVVLEATNRYSFTDLSQLHTTWSLIQASHTLSSGSARLSLFPRSHGQVRLNLPVDTLANSDTLRLDLDHPAGWNVATYQFSLKPIAHPAPHIQSISGVMFPQFNLLTGKVVKDEDGKGWRHLVHETGRLIKVKVQKADGSPTDMDEATLLATLFTDVRSLDAEVLLQPGSVAVGQIHAEVTNGLMNYRFTWSGEKSDIYELGWIFRAPKGCNHFSWSRQAVWSYYPPDHIGRPIGTATPDSADVELTKVDRPDAFDFNSTKFSCDWASLTDTAGRGLCVVFSPQQRQDVRGGFSDDGNCTLIVDLCYSPPRDISSNIVPDFYRILDNDGQIVGNFQINGIITR